MNKCIITAVSLSLATTFLNGCKPAEKKADVQKAMPSSVLDTLGMMRMTKHLFEKSHANGYVSPNDSLHVLPEDSFKKNPGYRSSNNVKIFSGLDKL